jgi:hypothetical protein
VSECGWVGISPEAPDQDLTRKHSHKCCRERAHPGERRISKRGPSQSQISVHAVQHTRRCMVCPCTQFHLTLLLAPLHALDASSNGHVRRGGGSKWVSLLLLVALAYTTWGMYNKNKQANELRDKLKTANAVLRQLRVSMPYPSLCP